MTCPKCQKPRLASAGPIAAKLRSGTGFTGECLSCSKNAKKREWIELSPGRKLDPVKGYIRVFLVGVSKEDEWLWRAMTPSTTYVMEHRLVMARTLGRPLKSNELVDHMDGDKLNNDPANLRIYIRGKNQPGETSGYGTYYHEWQQALARVRELESLLS